MKIVSPVDNHKEVEAIIKTGAGELYAGVISKNWKGKYSYLTAANRREWPKANFKNFSELKKAIDIAHSYDVPVFLTMNAISYSKNQYPMLLTEINKAIEIGIDALIVGDPGLLLTLKEKKIDKQTDIHISTVGTTFNSETVKFYKELGAKRIILPRHLKMDEIENLTKNKNMEFEVFIINCLCPNEDGFCTFQHALNVPEFSKFYLGKENGNHACRLNYDVSISPKNKDAIKHYLTWKNKLTKGICHFCGACAIYDFKKLNICSIKIVGRIHPTERKLRDSQFIKHIVDLTKENLSKEEFIAKCRDEYKRTYGFSCDGRCYPYNI